MVRGSAVQLAVLKWLTRGLQTATAFTYVSPHVSPLGLGISGHCSLPSLPAADTSVAASPPGILGSPDFPSHLQLPLPAAAP